MLYIRNVLLPLLAIATLSLAQDSQSNSTSNSTSPSVKLETEAIKAHFSNAGLVPQLLNSFQPSALLDVSYQGVGQIQPGQNLTSDEVKPTPTLTFTPANASVSLSGNYTVMMVDAGIVGSDQSKGQTRHWLANGCAITNNTLSLEHSLNVTDYAGPFPAEGSGAHRYVILVYSQPDSFTPPADFSEPGQPVGSFDLAQYLNSSSLASLVAANYLTVERGISNVTVSATSAVVTSTLPDATQQSTGTGSAKPTDTQTSPGNGAAALDVKFAGIFGSIVTGLSLIAGPLLLA